MIAVVGQGVKVCEKCHKPIPLPGKSLPVSLKQLACSCPPEEEEK